MKNKLKKMAEENATQAAQQPAGKTHTSICLACKKNYTFPIEFEGYIDTKNGVKRYAVKGHCGGDNAKNKKHEMSAFVKDPNKTAAAKNSIGTNDKAASV